MQSLPWQEVENPDSPGFFVLDLQNATNQPVDTNSA